MNLFQQIEAKIYDKKRLLRKINQWRFRDDKIVFSNGCFDLLHAGHVSTIAQAASFGDRLIIAINSDASVRKLKGEKRPLQKEANRALLIAAMQYVDAVIIFEEETPEELIKAILPDVLVKGGDYKIEEVVGSDIVLKNGGKVELAKFLDTYSSSNIIAQINESE